MPKEVQYHMDMKDFEEINLDIPLAVANPLFETLEHLCLHRAKTL
jgi:hypothetical protein